MVKRFFLLITPLWLIIACTNDPLDVDVSDITVDIQFERFDRKMFAGKSSQEMNEINTELIESGGELYEFYVYDMLHSGSVYDDSIGNYLYYFVSDSMMNVVVQDIESTFGDFKEQEEEIIDLFKHFKYHLPDAAVPKKIITYNSAFNYGVVSTSEYIGIGLEMYLGFDNRIIQKIGYPQFMKKKMDKDYMLVDVAHSWIISNLMGEDKAETFLSSMIYYGKLRYVVDAMLPDQGDHFKIRYTEEEYDWALASEYDIWQFLIDMDWIYSTDPKVNLRYFEEAPTTVDMEGSPGRIGQFMGWQIIKAYMEKNPDVTVQELINETNEGKILKAYKPEKE